MGGRHLRFSWKQRHPPPRVMASPYLPTSLRGGSKTHWRVSLSHCMPANTTAVQPHHVTRRYPLLGDAALSLVPVLGVEPLSALWGGALPPNTPTPALWPLP